MCDFQFCRKCATFNLRKKWQWKLTKNCSSFSEEIINYKYVLRLFSIFHRFISIFHFFCSNSFAIKKNLEQFLRSFRHFLQKFTFVVNLFVFRFYSHFLCSYFYAAFITWQFDFVAKNRTNSYAFLRIIAAGT